MHTEHEESEIRFDVSVIGITRHIFPTPKLRADDHEPPIGVGEGSCYLSFPVDIVNISGAPDSNGNFYYSTAYNKYLFRGSANMPKNYLGLAQVRILTERKDTADTDYTVYEVNQADEANINLWLHPSLPTGPPDIIIQGFDGGAVLTRKFLMFDVQTSMRKRYYNRSNPSNPVTDSDAHGVKLTKWQMVRGKRPSEVLVEGAEEDMFFLHVFFHHPTPPQV